MGYLAFVQLGCQNTIFFCATVSCRRGLTEAVNELKSRAIPLLASPQGGEGSGIKEISRSIQSRRGRGGFPCEFNRKTTPASLSVEASRHFVDRSATPPCGDARRGIALHDKFIHTFM
jgi:hypothetical protein